MSLRRRHLAAFPLLAAPALLGARGARAAGGPVRRLVIMTSPHQIMPHSFAMRLDHPARARFSYDLGGQPDSAFSPLLAPLAPHKKRLTVIEGLSLYTGIPADVEVNNHDASYTNLLTAAGIDAKKPHSTHGPSVDQVIARAVARPGQLPSLELGYEPYIGGVINQAADQRAPVIASPLQAYERLFPADRAAGDERRARIRARRPAVLDFVRQEYAATSPRLPPTEKQKLEQHTQLLGDLERRMLAVKDLADCRRPVGEYPDFVSPTRERFGMFAKLTAAALACDLTRVVSIQVRELKNVEFSSPPGSVHQDFAHQADSSEEAARHMTSYNRVYAELFATLLDELAAYRDGDGNLLDNCIVLWLSEHGLLRAPHAVVEMPIVMAGGGAGALPVGRYISVARTTPHPMFGRNKPIGTPHSHLLVSLLHAMGIKQDSVGLPEHRTAEGDVIKLSGPLLDLA